MRYANDGEWIALVRFVCEDIDGGEIKLESKTCSAVLPSIVVIIACYT
jgi:hypothetical protein